MKIKIHRGTHQIGGTASEITSLDGTRIIIDMGDELSMDDDFVPQPLDIPGVTDKSGRCDAVLFTHFHQDHMGQLKNLRDDAPIYMGKLAEKIAVASLRDNTPGLKERIQNAEHFIPGKPFDVGTIKITPYCIDHSACDSYMFLIEADNKKLLYTGDFRLHGFRGDAMPKILKNFIGGVDALITEGTALTRDDYEPLSEYELQGKLKKYIEDYKYVFVLCAASNLERVCAASHATPRGKYFLCDEYQYNLLGLMQEEWGGHSKFYRDLKLTWYSNALLEKIKKLGCVMTVRCNDKFRDIVKKFDAGESIMLYSMWDGYRTKEGSEIPEFLELTGKWETLHTSGHASKSAIKRVADLAKPSVIIPIHSESPEILRDVCPDKNVVVLNDGEELAV